MPTKMNKKGMEDIADTSDYSVYFTIVAFFIFIIFGLFLYFIAAAGANYVDPQFKQAVHVDRFLNNCFTYIDGDTGRKYPGTIDTSVFTQERLHQCYLIAGDTKVLGYKLTIESEGVSRTIQTANFFKGIAQERIPVHIAHDNSIVLGSLYVTYQE